MITDRPGMTWKYQLNLDTNGTQSKLARYICRDKFCGMGVRQTAIAKVTTYYQQLQQAQCSSSGDRKPMQTKGALVFLSFSLDLNCRSGCYMACRGRRWAIRLGRKHKLVHHLIGLHHGFTFSPAITVGEYRPVYVLNNSMCYIWQCDTLSAADLVLYVDRISSFAFHLVTINYL